MTAVAADFSDHDPPARAAYQVAALPKEGLVEIEAIAIRTVIEGETPTATDV